MDKAFHARGHVTLPIVSGRMEIQFRMGISVGNIWYTDKKAVLRSLYPAAVIRDANHWTNPSQFIRPMRPE